jgi:hypothetical protein
LALTVPFEDIAVGLSAYKARHANSAPKIRLATMASNKARDGRFSPRAMLIWLVIMMQLVSASQSQSRKSLLPLRAKEPQRAASSY